MFFLLVGPWVCLVFSLSSLGTLCVNSCSMSTPIICIDLLKVSLRRSHLLNCLLTRCMLTFSAMKACFLRCYVDAHVPWFFPSSLEMTQQVNIDIKPCFLLTPWHSISSLLLYAQNQPSIAAKRWVCANDPRSELADCLGLFGC